MTTTIRRLALAILTTIALTLPAAAIPAQAAGCAYVLGFDTLHAMDPADIGDCQDNQYLGNPNGDQWQHTTKGLMVWRKADNWTAFTNGYQTWLNGPAGLVTRLNTDRFPWEADATTATAAPPAGPHTFYASNASNARTIYCDTDPGWKQLAASNLQTYSSLTAAQQANPAYTLHQPC